MKLLYLIEDYSVKGGAERIISLKANEFAARSHEVTVVSVYHDNRPLSYPLADGVRFVSLDVPMAKSPLHRPYTLYITWQRLNKTLRELQPDVVFFTMVIGALLLPLVKTHARRIYESHSARAFTPYHRFFGWMERSADAIVCLTADDAREYGHAKAPVRVIPNFVDTHSTRQPDYTAHRAIAVGRLEEAKGFDRLIDVWKNISRLHPDWRLDVYGDGSQRDALQAQIDALQLHGIVTLCGRDNNILDRYAEHSLSVSSSRYEGLPMTLLEAASCGLPIVTFDFRYGARESVEQGENGLLVPQDDVEALAEALSRLLSSEELRRKYGQKSREMAQRFSKEAVMRQWMELIQSPSKPL